LIEARREALLAWYDRNRRHLPWRDEADPYSVLVSEIMAQQTQISRVVPHFERFVENFPTVEALAAAPFRRVLGAWSGLGYNRRARFLHEAAQRIVAEGWPDSAAALQALPGVGPYTAAAVASIAFGEPIAAVDTNARRVLSRWEGVELSGTGLQAAADSELPASRAADWNQAIMDLGAGHCRPRPHCVDCPVDPWCKDPSVYAPPASQSTFAGSVRQARGAVLRKLLEEGVSPATVLTELGIEPNRLAAALESLRNDGLIKPSGEAWVIAD
jgi:A/G-specific adenine glycosylase